MDTDSFGSAPNKSSSKPCAVFVRLTGPFELLRRRDGYTMGAIFEVKKEITERGNSRCA